MPEATNVRSLLPPAAAERASGAQAVKLMTGVRNMSLSAGCLLANVGALGQVMADKLAAGELTGEQADMLATALHNATKDVEAACLLISRKREAVAPPAHSAQTGT